MKVIAVEVIGFNGFMRVSMTSTCLNYNSRFLIKQWTGPFKSLRIAVTSLALLYSQSKLSNVPKYPRFPKITTKKNC